MRNLLLIALVCFTAIYSTSADDEKQIKLEDIERDTLLHESDRSSDVNGPKELAPQPTQHIQLSYSNNPQDVFVTPTPGRYAVKANSIADYRQQVYHLPKVHEAEQTYTVSAKQTLIKPIIGGGAPIHPTMVPQPQYIYIQSPPQAHHPYISQAPAYVMVPVVHQAPSPVQPPVPTPTIYTYSQPQPSNSPPTLHHHQQQPGFHAIKSVEYAVPSAPVAPLHTAVDYKNIPTLVPKDALPSISTTSFRQYYSPGLEYHYTEIVPSTKLQPASPSYAYHHAPTHNYQTSYVSQPAPIQYYQNVPSYKQQQPSQALFEPYHSGPGQVTYAKPQISYKNYYPSAPSLPQQLFTPANYPSSSSHYPYPSSQVYNTIAYSVPYPPYDHSKRSTKSTATASVNVKAPKSS